MPDVELAGSADRAVPAHEGIFSGGDVRQLILGALVLVSASPGFAKPPEQAAAAAQTTVIARRGLHSPWDMRQIAASAVPHHCGDPIQVDPTITILKSNYQRSNSPASDAVKAGALRSHLLPWANSHRALCVRLTLISRQEAFRRRSAQQNCWRQPQTAMRWPAGSLHEM